ncbi:hypothetical protein GOP47_0022928 [Adiantum capillus-veneris]|uniref:Uncharacterized protein n=1 Tax=Adiantum capillus-veneris TaxID=13818 RepID=A0A9D4U6C2_ADICA|nr:hypothetical protein GOP47_0022928 [Adiantum capillus-veneris]
MNPSSPAAAGEKLAITAMPAPPAKPSPRPKASATSTPPALVCTTMMNDILHGVDIDHPCGMPADDRQDYDDYDLPCQLHHEELDLLPDEDVYASDVIGRQHEVGCGNPHSSADKILHDVDIDHPCGMPAADDRQGVLLAPLATHNEVRDAIPSLVNIKVDDFVVVDDDGVQYPYGDASPSDHQGFPATLPSFPPCHDGGGSIGWCQVFAKAESDSDDDDWLLC